MHRDCVAAVLEDRAPVPPALAGPLELTAFRASRVDPLLVGGAPGMAGAALREVVGPGSSVSVDDRPALHVHEYVAAGICVRGLVGLLDLATLRRLTGDQDQRSAEAVVLPHEGVDPVRVRRLVTHMSTLHLDPAPVLLVGDPHADAAGSLAAVLDLACARGPDHEMDDARGTHHRLWTLGPDLAEPATAAVLHQRLLLADGHHRYAAHLELLEARPSVGDHHMMVMVVDSPAHTPVVRAIHRVVRGLSLDLVESLFSRAGHTVRHVPHGPAHPAGSDDLVVVGHHSTTAVALRRPPGRSVVEVVHDVLDGAPGRGAWHYHHDSLTALQDLERAPRALALLLPAASLTEIWDAALQGRTLPTKATSFQPKSALGVLFRSWPDR